MKGIYTYNGTEYEFEYKTVLKAMQRLMTIMNIEQVLLHDGQYYSLLKDIAIKYYILRAYAPDFEYPTAITDADGDLDWDEIEIFFADTNIYATIAENADTIQFEEMLENLDNDLAYQTGIDKASITNELIRLIHSYKEILDLYNQNQLTQS